MIQLRSLPGRRLPVSTILAVLAILLPAASCNSSGSDDDDALPSSDDDDGALPSSDDDDGALPSSDDDDDDDAVVPTGGEATAEWTVTPTQLSLDLFETAQLNFSGAAPFDVQYTIGIDAYSPGLNFFNASPGAYEPARRRIREFHTSGEETFAVSIQVECLATTETTVRFRLDSNLSADPIDVQINCATGGSSSGSGTGDPSESESESESTTGPTADADLICRYLYGETLQSVVVDGPNTGVEDFEPGFYIGSWDTDASDGAVIASTSSKVGPVGFGRWASAQDLLTGEPETFIEDDTAPSSGRACASSAGAVFAGTGIDATFCDFTAGTCTSLGLDSPMAACACVGMECLGFDLTQVGFLYSTDGGQSFTRVMEDLQPAGLKSNTAGAIMFRNEVSGTWMVGPSFGGPFSASDIPDGAEVLGPNLLGNGVTFMGDLGGGTSLTLRSEDDGLTFTEVMPPGGVPLRQMFQLPDGRVMVSDAEVTLWLSTDATATDWVPRDDLDLLSPYNCLPVGAQ